MTYTTADEVYEQVVQTLPEIERARLMHRIARGLTTTLSPAELHNVESSSIKDRYPLHGTVLDYKEPTEPVAEEDWEALR